MVPFVELDLPPGRAVEWTLRPSAKVDTSASVIETTKRPSFSQELYYHLIEWQSRLHEGRLAVWIGTTFEIAGKVDLDALRATFRYLLARHEILRSEFRMNPDPDESHGLFGLLQCDVMRPEAVALDQTELGEFDDVKVLHDAIIERVDNTIDTNKGPVLLMGAVVGEEKTVAYIICDHIVTDGFSCAIKAHELGTIYEAIIAGKEPQLPETGSYLEFGKQEYAASERVEADDPRIQLWHGFVERNGHVFTEFPVDLHTKKGSWHPATCSVVRMLDPEEAGAFEQICRAEGASVMSGLLAVNGIALHEISGVEVFRTVMPIATRQAPKWQSAVGWFVGLIPLEVPLAGADRFFEVLAGAHKAFRTALSAADLPMISVFMHLGSQYLPHNGFFDLRPQTHFSYTDYRELPGATRADIWRQTSALRVSNTSDARTWFFRTPEGIFMFNNFIETPRASEVRVAFEAGFRRVLEGVLAPVRWLGATEEERSAQPDAEVRTEPVAVCQKGPSPLKKS